MRQREHNQQPPSAHLPTKPAVKNLMVVPIIWLKQRLPLIHLKANARNYTSPLGSFLQEKSSNLIFNFPLYYHSINILIQYFYKILILGFFFPLNANTNRVIVYHAFHFMYSVTIWNHLLPLVTVLVLFSVVNAEPQTNLLGIGCSTWNVTRASAFLSNRRSVVSRS